MIDTVLSLDEVRNGISWTELEIILTTLGAPYLEVVELVFYQLQKDRPYRISREFIMDLGNAYLTGKTMRVIKGLA